MAIGLIMSMTFSSKISSEFLIGPVDFRTLTECFTGICQYEIPSVWDASGRVTSSSCEYF